MSLWKYFSKTEHKNIATCNLCAEEVKIETSINILAHLKAKHVLAFEKYMKEKKIQVKNDLDKKGILEDVDNPNQNKPSTSECNKLQSSLAVECSSTSSTSSHSLQDTMLKCVNKKSKFSFKQDRSCIIKYRAVTKALVYMICRDNMPTSTVEKEGFMYYTKTLCPLYKLPSRSELTTLIEEQYTMCRSQLKKILNEVHYVSLTSDICKITSLTRSFLIISGHFINSETSILHSFCLEAIPLTERHTVNIVEQFHRICKEFSLNTAKIVSITTDANMQKAAQVFADSKWVWCFAHITNLVVQASLDNMVALQILISRIRRIFAYFKDSTIASDALRTEQLKHGKSEDDMLYLTQDIYTPWNSTLEMLDKFEKLAPVLRTILASKNHGGGALMIKESNMKVVSEINHLLAPFKEATVQISAEKYFSASMVLPLCRNVLDTLYDYKPTTTLAIKLKETLLKEIEVKYIPLEKNKLLTIATLLDPRFKRIYSFSSLRQAEAISQIRQEIKEIAKRQDSLPTLEESSCNTVQHGSNSIWIRHEEKVQKHEYNPPTTQMSDELQSYFISATLPLLDNPIEYWHKNKEASPALTEVALKYLTIMGSSVTSERIVSAINNVVTDKRSKLHIKEAVFLTSYLTQNS